MQIASRELLPLLQGWRRDEMDWREGLGDSDQLFGLGLGGAGGSASEGGTPLWRELWFPMGWLVVGAPGRKTKTPTD